MNPSINIAPPNTPETSLPDAPALPGRTGAGGLAVTRVAERHWHALEDDRVVGRGEVLRRPDGRNFVSIDAWHSDIFTALAATMLADLPRPLYTVTDEADHELTAQWQWAGFTLRRREYECVLPTDPSLTGLQETTPPPGIAVLGLGRADAGQLRELDRLIRDQVEAEVGWQEMPTEVLPRTVGPDDPMIPARPGGGAESDAAVTVVAAQEDRYVGLLRLSPSLRLAPRRRPRISLVAVLADQRRRGIARALLAEALGGLHRAGKPVVSVDVNEANAAAVALFDGVDARRDSSNLELVIR